MTYHPKRLGNPNLSVYDQRFARLSRQGSPTPCCPCKPMAAETQLDTYAGSFFCVNQEGVPIVAL